MATTYLSRTFGTPTNRKKWTFSVWAKRADKIDEGVIFSGYAEGCSSGNCYSTLRDNGNARLDFTEYNTSSYVINLRPSAEQRDTTGWYHLVLAYDSTQVVAADRVNYYINGVSQTSWGTETYPSLNQDSGINQAALHTIGKNTASDNGYFNGYMAQFVFIDGLQYAATTFGSTDATTGEWKPKSDGEIRSAVTFGTNGCLLPFSNASYLGYDYQTSDRSGTTNDFTVSGSGYQTQDNPSNNFCTLNLNFAVTGQYSNPAKELAYADLAGYPTGNNGLPATMGASKGKWYWESRPVSASTMTGIMSGSASALGAWDGSYADGFTSYGGNKAIMYGTESGGGYLMGVTTSTAAFGTILNNSTDVVGVAMDLDNNNLYLSVNGVWQNSGVPTSGATGTGAVPITVQSGQPALGNEVWFPAMHTFSSSSTVEFNFGQGYFGSTSVGATEADDAGIGVFKYDVPAGFYALCTKNLKTYG